MFISVWNKTRSLVGHLFIRRSILKQNIRRNGRILRLRCRSPLKTETKLSANRFLRSCCQKLRSSDGQSVVSQFATLSWQSAGFTTGRSASASSRWLTTSASKSKIAVQNQKPKTLEVEERPEMKKKIGGKLQKVDGRVET